VNGIPQDDEIGALLFQCLEKSVLAEYGQQVIRSRVQIPQNEHLRIVGQGDDSPRPAGIVFRAAGLIGHNIVDFPNEGEGFRFRKQLDRATEDAAYSL